MRCTLNKTNYKDFDILEVNRLPGRAYAIPYSDMKTLRNTPFEKERADSDQVRVLSGEWDFKYFADIAELPDVLDTDALDFDKVRVPSTWQRTGYEAPAYINCPYPFDNVPPELPDKMSCGVYRLFFDVTETDKVHLLDFLGAVSCIDVYLNGAFVGYGEGAHNTSEFAIDPYLKAGRNELVVVIHKWSTGTFLECQDMFRENGIFRDVLLYELPQTYIRDYEVRTRKTANGYDLSVLTLADAGTAEITLMKDGEAVARTSAPAGETAVLRDLAVAEWNPEIPTVYELYITLTQDGKPLQTIRSFTGFRTVEIVGHVFYYNGQKIKFKGVNHHDTHETKGYALDFDDLLRDVRLMKQFNVNAVRTSHYPPDPQFLTLCDLYGLYVVDEADIETHGCGCDPHNNIDLISHDPKWAPRYLDRVRRMYLRDRNHPSVTMWSLGNEAGGYACQDVCYAYLHEVCPEIPVHYEGVCRNDRVAYDVVSEMYTHDDLMRAVRERKRGEIYASKPFFLCEYCHAMGVGPGALEEYWDIIYSDDIFMGGCIWEWADHSVKHADGRYTYGGDHGEWRHDGSFCVDGLFYPDRTPHTGALEMQVVYRPVRASYTGGGRFRFENTNRFRASGYLKTTYEIYADGALCASGTLPLDIAPLAAADAVLPLPQTSDDCFVNFIYTDADRTVATEQVAVREAIPAFGGEDGGVTAEESDKYVTFRFEGGEAQFCKQCGALRQYTAGGVSLFNEQPVGKRGFRPNLYRALLDNDCAASWKWRSDARLHDLVYICKSFSHTDTGAVAIYSVEGGSSKLFELTLRYTVYGKGTVEVRASLLPCCTKAAVEDLPRFGLSLELPEKMRAVRYYGRGTQESMPDCKAQSPVGVYETTVDALQENYIKPQDNGNHGDTRYVELTDGSGRGLRFTAEDKAFSFSARPFTDTLLSNAKHREDLHDEHTTVLNIDGFVRGTGTASCGQDTLPQYRISAKEGLSFRFRFAPII
ncbi:MAG: hypothetical protein IJT44_07900 [Clostridia bacterium]|nr:hypothetical protein [Clostridia bacterium]